MNSQECKRFEIDAVTIKKYVTEYHHLTNSQAYIFILTQQSMGEVSTWQIWAFVYFHSFEALNDAFDVQFFQGFIFTPYQRY